MSIQMTAGIAFMAMGVIVVGLLRTLVGREGLWGVLIDVMYVLVGILGTAIFLGVQL